MTQDIVSIRKELIGIAQQAIAADDEKNYDEAIKLYTKAVEKLQYLTKLDESPMNKETYKKKAKEYYDRAMELKKNAPTEDKKQPVSSEGYLF